MANLSNTLDTNNISSKEAAYAEISSKLNQAQQRYKQIDENFEKNKKKLTLEDLKAEYAYRKKAERELEAWRKKELLAKQLKEKSFSEEQFKRELAAALSRVDEETRLKEESDNRIQGKREK
jgi:pantothenate kinase-related protein Tda10